VVWPQAPPRCLEWTDLAEGRLCLDRLPATAHVNFFPRRFAASSRNKQVAACRPPLRCGPAAAVRSPLGLAIAIEAAMSAASRSDKENVMAIIGTFTKSGDGYTGSLKTVTLSVKAKITPAEKENDKAPDFRIFAGQSEFGAAWKRTSNAGREYLSVKLDDPSFPAPVFASLVETENDGLVLIWSRRSAD
jgi:uncharacterized protein (DUF736 family)